MIQSTDEGFERLAKENGGQRITDEGFARAIGLAFYIDGDTEMVRRPLNNLPDDPPYEASDIEICLWDQLRHAYGFAARGTCNSSWERGRPVRTERTPRTA